VVVDVVDRRGIGVSGPANDGVCQRSSCAPARGWRVREADAANESCYIIESQSCTSKSGTLVALHRSRAGRPAYPPPRAGTAPQEYCRSSTPPRAVCAFRPPPPRQTGHTDAPADSGGGVVVVPEVVWRGTGRCSSAIAAQVGVLAEATGDVGLGALVGRCHEHGLGLADLDEVRGGLDRLAKHERRLVRDARRLLHVVRDDDDGH